MVIAHGQGQVLANADCPLDEALLLMRARARSADLGVAYIAKAIVEGSICFDD